MSRRCCHVFLRCKASPSTGVINLRFRSIFAVCWYLQAVHKSFSDIRLPKVRWTVSSLALSRDLLWGYYRFRIHLGPILNMLLYWWHQWWISYSGWWVSLHIDKNSWFLYCLLSSLCILLSILEINDLCLKFTHRF